MTKGYKRGDLVQYTGEMLWELCGEIGICLEQSVNDEGRFYPVGFRGGVFTILFGNHNESLCNW